MKETDIVRQILVKSNKHYNWLTLLSWVPLDRPQVLQPFGSSQHFMEPEGSLLSLQELSTCTYPEPNQSSPKHSILYLKDQIITVINTI
jgi:hypothetical protein